MQGIFPTPRGTTVFFFSWLKSEETCFCKSRIYWSLGNNNGHQDTKNYNVSNPTWFKEDSGVETYILINLIVGGKCGSSNWCVLKPNIFFLPLRFMDTLTRFCCCWVSKYNHVGNDVYKTITVHLFNSKTNLEHIFDSQHTLVI